MKKLTILAGLFAFAIIACHSSKGMKNNGKSFNVLVFSKTKRGPRTSFAAAGCQCPTCPGAFLRPINKAIGAPSRFQAARLAATTHHRRRRRRHRGPTDLAILARAATFGPSPWKPWFVAGAAVLLTIATVALAWPRAAPEPIALAAPVSAPVVVVPAPLPPTAVKPAPTRAEKTAKKAAKKQPARERR